MQCTPTISLASFADDTYLIKPAGNVDSRYAELECIETWAQTNNRTLNQSKQRKSSSQTTDGGVGFYHHCTCRTLSVSRPSRFLVSMTNGLSASNHKRDVIISCVLTQYVLRIWRAHGMSLMALQAIFLSVILGKLPCAASASSGFIKMSDWKRVDFYLRLSMRCGYCPPFLLFLFCSRSSGSKSIKNCSTLYW